MIEIPLVNGRGVALVDDVDGQQVHIGCHKTPGAAAEARAEWLERHELSGFYRA